MGSDVDFLIRPSYLMVSLETSLLQYPGKARPVLEVRMRTLGCKIE